MLSPPRSPRSRSKNATLKALSPRSSRQSGNLGTTRAITNNYGAQNSYENNSTGLSQVRFRNCQPRIDYENKVVHIQQELLSFMDLKIGTNTRYLDVKNNLLVDFKGLPSLPKLEELNVSNNNIENLYSFPPLPSLKKIDCSNTPFSGTEFYRVSLILMCPSLHSINNELVKINERRVAKEFNQECVHLLRAGWILKYPPPTQDKIISIKRKLTKENRKKIQSNTKSRLPKVQFLGQKKQSKLDEKCIKEQEDEIERLKSEITALQAEKENERKLEKEQSENLQSSPKPKGYTFKVTTNFYSPSKKKHAKTMNDSNNYQETEQNYTEEEDVYQEEQNNYEDAQYYNQEEEQQTYQEEDQQFYQEEEQQNYQEEEQQQLYQEEEEQPYFNFDDDQPNTQSEFHNEEETAEFQEVEQHEFNQDEFGLNGDNQVVDRNVDDAFDNENKDEIEGSQKEEVNPQEEEAQVEAYQQEEPVVQKEEEVPQEEAAQEEAAQEEAAQEEAVTQEEADQQEEPAAQKEEEEVPQEPTQQEPTQQEPAQQEPAQQEPAQQEAAQEEAVTQEEVNQQEVPVEQKEEEEVPQEPAPQEEAVAQEEANQQEEPAVQKEEEEVPQEEAPQGENAQTE